MTESIKPESAGIEPEPARPAGSNPARGDVDPSLPPIRPDQFVQRASLWPALFGGSIIVALTTPFNFILLFWSYGFLAWLFGSHFACNPDPGLLYFSAVLLNLSIYLGFVGQGMLVWKACGCRGRAGVIVALTCLYIALWIGLDIWIAIDITARDAWP